MSILYGKNEGDKIILGSGFLRGPYAVFDLDRNLVGCEPLYPLVFET